MLQLSTTDHLSSTIEVFYTQTRPYRQDLEEQEKLFNYITECTNYLQKQYMTTIEDKKKSSKPMRVTREAIQLHHRMHQLSAKAIHDNHRRQEEIEQTHARNKRSYSITSQNAPTICKSNT